MSDVTRHLSVHGRVQGVFFRAWSAEQASRLALRGWVRNRIDGSVEMLIHGAEPDVAAMIALCRKGPPAARVERIDVDDADEPIPAGFEKRPTV